MSNRLRNIKIAIHRLTRDLIELEQEGLLSISAEPLDDNIFEWHVNIKPINGVYRDVYFHLIMTFPETYPTNPPEVKICTPISHPNVFSSGFICLSMLRAHTGNVPYEGWSGAYSVTSILMQLQSFLFAEKIDQDGGYQLNAQLSDYDVNRSIQLCKSFKCNGKNGCGHSHSTPWPEVKGPPEALIKIVPTDPKSKHVIVSGSSCQTARTSLVGVRSKFGCKVGRVFYEAFIDWTGNKLKKNKINVGLCRFGFGSRAASNRLCDGESFGYDGAGVFQYNDQFTKFGESFTKDDIITVAIDFGTKRIYFAKNGKIQEPNIKHYIPKYLRGKLLFPMLSFKNSRVEFNFCKAKKPCKWLIDQGFRTLEQVNGFDGEKEEDVDDDYDDDTTNDENNTVDWHSYMIIDELWLSIFESLGVSEVYGAQFVCKQWYKIINKYNIIDRHQICCYYTKAKMGEGEGKILGIGLNITRIARGHGFDIHSQMDILSLNAWINGCRTGVWGEPLTHFLPLAMNKAHCEIAHNWIIEYLQKISKTVKIQSEYANTGMDPLLLVDTLITMMNRIVVQFSMGNEHTSSSKVSMVMCEKVVLGYCALHHLLLYLTSKNSEIIHNYANEKVSDFINKPNGCTKKICKDLGKFLIYLLISPKYSWNDVADIFVKEAFTRQVRWMVKDKKYEKYDTTKQTHGRIQDTFTATKISRRLIMFQVWFMQNNANETLKGSNDRLGRPRTEVKLGIVEKTKQIINSTKYQEFFDSLGVGLQNPIKELDQLLRFAVWDSKQKGYHYHRGYNHKVEIQKIAPPEIIIIAREKDRNRLIEPSSLPRYLQPFPNHLTSQIVKPGDGRTFPDPCGVVELKYSAYKCDGCRQYWTRFLSLDNLQTKLGNNENIIGLEQAVLSMTKGEIARVWIPSRLAHGVNGDQSAIPSNTDLVFELTLVDVGNGNNNNDNKVQRRRRGKRNKNKNDNNNDKALQHHQQPKTSQPRNNNHLNKEIVMNNNNHNGEQQRQMPPTINDDNNNQTQQQQQQLDGGNDRDTRRGINNNNSDSKQRPTRPPLRQSQIPNGSNHNSNHQRQSGQHEQNNDNSNNHRARPQEAGSGNNDNNNNGAAGLSKSQRRKMRKRRKNSNNNPRQHQSGGGRGRDGNNGNLSQQRATRPPLRQSAQRPTRPPLRQSQIQNGSNH